jgi:hypothetical protein
VIEGTPSQVPDEPAYLRDLPLQDVFSAERDEHTQSRDEDEPRPDELPGGVTFQAIFAEAEEAGGWFWDHLPLDEKRRYATQAAVGRRQARERPASTEAAATAHGLTVLSWAEILAEPPTPPPTIRAGIPKVGLTVVAGSPKIGKTLWCSQLALEMRVPALLVIEEGSRSGISYRLRRQAETLGVQAPAMSVMYRQRIRLDDKRSVANLRAYIAEVRPALIEFDPLNRLHGADENRPTQMTPVMDSLANIAYDFECCVIAVHHMAKPSAERRGDVWDRFRGASSIRSGTDANIVLDGTTDRVHLLGEARDGEPISEWLELDRETLTFAAGEEPDGPKKIDPIALRAFVEERSQVTAKQVLERFEVSKHTALTALRGLGCDEFNGPRGTILFSLGQSLPTVQ